MGESKVLQYFGSVIQNSETPDAFVTVVKVTNCTEYSDCLILSCQRQSPSRVERMHFSLGVTGLGRTSVGCVLSVRRYGRVCPGSNGSRSRSTLTGIFEPQGVVTQALTLLGGARFIAGRLKCLFLCECWRDLRHFWSSQACLCYGLAPRAHLKRPCATLVGGTCDKYRYFLVRSASIAWSTALESTVFGLSVLACSNNSSEISWTTWLIYCDQLNF